MDIKECVLFNDGYLVERVSSFLWTRDRLVSETFQETKSNHQKAYHQQTVRKLKSSRLIKEQQLWKYWSWKATSISTH